MITMDELRKLHGMEPKHIPKCQAVDRAAHDLAGIPYCDEPAVDSIAIGGSNLRVCAVHAHYDFGRDVASDYLRHRAALAKAVRT